MSFFPHPLEGLVYFPHTLPPWISSVVVPSARHPWFEFFSLSLCPVKAFSSPLPFPLSISLPWALGSPTSAAGLEFELCSLYVYLSNCDADTGAGTFARLNQED